MPRTPLSLKFIGDLPGDASGDALLVESDRDYCRASALIRGERIDDHQAIWVRREHHFSWLKAQITHCEQGLNEDIEITRTSPSLLLSERWGREIPQWLTDELILAEGLLKRDLPEDAPDVARGLLSPYFGVLPEKLSARTAGKLVAQANGKFAEASSDRLAMTAWKSVLADWKDEGGKGWVSDFCRRLEEEPAKLWNDLTAWRLLRRYPISALDFAIDVAAASFVRGLPDEFGMGMDYSPTGIQWAFDQINPLLAKVVEPPASRQKFEFILGGASGELNAEFSAIRTLLENADFQVSGEDLREIRTRFSGCPGLSETNLSRLDLFIAPNRPTEDVPVDAGATTWKSWALNEYLPYRWWQIQRRSADSELEATLVRFSEWYCEHYASVHADPASSSVQIISRWRDQILTDHVSLILLVDNLPWFFWPMLEKALAESGLHRHGSEFTFAPLPSHTAVCKPQLVSGRQDATGTDYLKLLRNRSTHEWQDRQVHYLSGIDQLNALPSAGEPYVALLNYLAADEALHGDADATGTTWTEQLELLFGKLAAAVGEFSKRVSADGRDFGLYVVTDHGAALILPEEKRTADAQLAKKLFPNEKHRSATMSPSEAAQIPENLWTLGHRLNLPFDERTHFIPRAHNTVASGGNRAVFMHGGATPEEVLVPSGVFRAYSASWLAPKVRLIDLALTEGRARFYIKRMVELRFEIQNPNGDPCELKTLEIQPEVAELRRFDFASIPTKGTAQGAMSLYFSESALDVEKLTIRFNVGIGVETVSQSVELPVTISSAQSGGLDLRNLFP